MAQTSSDRLLRRICAFSWIWTLAFLLPYGIITRSVVPPLLIIPMTLSLVCSIYHLTGKATCRQLNASIDAGVAAFLLGMVIPATIAVRTNYNYRARDLILVGAYGTPPAMINCAIHAYFAFREASILHALSLVFGNVFSSPTCPHCQREVLYKWGFATSTPSSSSVSKESYVSIRHNDDEEEGEVVEGRASSSKDPQMAYKDPRPSTDDESARLV